MRCSPIEWVVGHNRDVYFVTMRVTDQVMAQMNRNQQNEMDDYLENAPQNQRSPPDGTNNYENYHYKYQDKTLDYDPNRDRDGNERPREPNFFKRRIEPGQPGYIPRDPLFRGAFKGRPRRGEFNLNEIYMFEYKDADVRGNRRAECEFFCRLCEKLV